MGEITDNHTLWVNLSSLGAGNVFAVLPQIMEQMLSDNVFEGLDDFTDVVLPSDQTWQTKIYYQLVERQRQAEQTDERSDDDDDDDNDDKMYDPYLAEEKPKMHEWNTLPPRVKAVECDLKIDKYNKKTKVKIGLAAITWTVSDIAKAGCLLSSPPIPTNFEDEQEMRRVYTLIYDVFRYKNVLTQTLNDVNFFLTFPKLSESVPVVWLLLYDLYHRSFIKRETSIAPLAHQLFDAYGLSFADNALWTQKIKLAAAVARLRIKNAALSLSELLPPHLKDEKVTQQAQNNPVTCWINIYKIKDSKSFSNEVEKAFSLKMVSDVSRLSRNTFKWDRHCPQIIVFHASLRTRLAKSSFVKNHILVVQDKSFCLGPATFKKLVTDLELAGSVIQTHVNSPRTTAYLATLLSQNEKIKKLMAFSAGKRKQEYESYFSQLGMSNIKLFSDRLIDTPADASYMEEVVAVFATPPNSYSAVVDPIDLVCSRGGDLSMLEVLTETGDTKEARDRVAGVLEEQQKTLRFAMSRPQIQFVLYETHSELEAENRCMVDKALREINRIAKLQHVALQGQAKIILPPCCEDKEMKEINNNENVIKAPEEQIETKPEESILSETLPPEGPENLLDKIIVPNTDIFDNFQLPMLCPSESCKGFQKEVCGCYLALLQRKEIIRLDDKYMIQMAENRGLFGSTNTRAVKTKSTRTARRKAEKPEKHEVVKKKLKDSEIERIATPTFTFLRHTKTSDEVTVCPRDISPPPAQSIYRNWWKETSRHITGIRKRLIRQKLIPPPDSTNGSAIGSSESRQIVKHLQKNLFRVDEIVKETNMNKKIPIFPRLKLKRSRVFERNQVPLTVTYLNFPYRCIFYNDPNLTKLPETDNKVSGDFERPLFHEEHEGLSEVDTFLRLDNDGSNFTIGGSESNDLSVDNSLTKDVYIMHKPIGSRKLLSKMNSAQIRQFVSPYYRQFDILPRISSPILEARTSSEYTKISTRVKKGMLQKSGLGRSRSKRGNKSEQDGHTERRERTKKLKFARSAEGIKKKKIAAVVARVCIPTQSILMKRTSDVKEIEAQDKETCKKTRPSALECSKRVYHCDLCRRRNETS